VIASPKGTEPKLWHRNLNFTYAFASGNSQLSNVSVAGAATHEDPTTRFTFNGLLREGRLNNQSSNLLTSLARWERKPTSVLSLSNLPLFGEVRYEKDALARLDHRLGLNGGVNLALMQSKNRELAVAAGAGLSYESFGTGLDRASGSGLFRIVNKQPVFGQARLEQQFELFPDLNQVGHYRATGESSLLVPFTKSLSLRTGILDRFESWPQGQAKPNDFSAQSGLVVNF